MSQVAQRRLPRQAASQRRLSRQAAMDDANWKTWEYYRTLMDPDTPAQPSAEASSGPVAKPASEPAAEPTSEPAARPAATKKKTNAKAVKQCDTCHQYFSMSNLADHKKVHRLKNGLGARALRPCEGCKNHPDECIVSRIPGDINTYACMSCLKSHKACDFNKACHGRPGGNDVHPALIYERAKGTKSKA
ncbi:hypothetical protein IL306_003306 [Fusarium sp. DS 682]|nr:hypothetical protein IL306_003306 [Fusarium sp. DS 682]